MTNTKKRPEVLRLIMGQTLCLLVDKPMVCVAVPETSPWMSFVKELSMLMPVE